MDTNANNFKMLVLGDSILWGQGLHEHQKIHTLVTEYLIKHGLNVQTIFQAHSGAIIGEPDQPTDKPAIFGEVPVGEPTLFEQLQTALGDKQRDETINLVLISGGVNDVDTTRILNLANRQLAEQIEDAFHRKLKLFLERAYHCFPNAILIVSGYYQVFSDESEKSLAQNALQALGFNVPLLPKAINDIVVDVLGSVITDALIERCIYFRDTAHDTIRQVIVELVDMMPEASERIFFADPKFGSANAIAAPDAFLFGINADLSPQDPPEIAAARAEACERHADRLTIVERVAGPRASVAHPNPLGAQQYAQAIIDDLRYAIPALFINP